MGRFLQEENFACLCHFLKTLVDRGHCTGGTADSQRVPAGGGKAPMTFSLGKLSALGLHLEKSFQSIPWPPIGTLPREHTTLQLASHFESELVKTYRNTENNTIRVDCRKYKIYPDQF